MGPLPFNLQFIQFLADHRTVPLTRFFFAVTTFGTFDVYVLVITIIYVAWNKQLAIRLSVLMLLTSSLNGLLKVIIKNPRPFVLQGTYLKKWAVPPGDADSLANGYSTPSGHAMEAASFYTYLFRRTENRNLKALAIAVIVLIGFSRPYLGVHYGEDVLLGWGLGLSCALAAAKYFDAFCARWARLPAWSQVGITFATSLSIWIIAYALNGSNIDGEPRAILGDSGFLTGIVIARPLELRLVNFDPRSSSITDKIARFLFTGLLVLFTLFSLNLTFTYLCNHVVWLELVSDYIRFTVAGIVNIFLAPLLFTRLGFAKTVPAPSN